MKGLYGNATAWKKASRSAINGVRYDYSGDELVVPGETARLEVYLVTPRDVKPLEVVVALELGGLGTVYSQPLELFQTG